VFEILRECRLNFFHIRTKFDCILGSNEVSIWKETVVACFKELSFPSPGETEVNTSGSVVVVCTFRIQSETVDVISTSFARLCIFRGSVRACIVKAT
jgi:hypothetical protein